MSEEKNLIELIDLYNSIDSKNISEGEEYYLYLIKLIKLYVMLINQKNIKKF